MQKNRVSLLVLASAFFSMLLWGCSEDKASSPPPPSQQPGVVPSPSPSPSPSPTLSACELSGGTITQSSCCQSVGDFPNTCSVGACGCAPDFSHLVLTCSCPDDQCWNGAACVPSSPPVTPAEACENSGGTVTMTSCCLSVGDFPNTCLMGACACSPSSSHMVQTCNCPASTCWNGSSCSGVR